LTEIIPQECRARYVLTAASEMWRQLLLTRYTPYQLSARILVLISSLRFQPVSVFEFIYLSSSGLNVGCFYGVSTLLNRMIIEHYPVSPSYPANHESPWPTCNLHKLLKSHLLLFSSIIGGFHYLFISFVYPGELILIHLFTFKLN